MADKNNLRCLRYSAGMDNLFQHSRLVAARRGRKGSHKRRHEFMRAPMPPHKTTLPMHSQRRATGRNFARSYPIAAARECCLNSWRTKPPPESGKRGCVLRTSSEPVLRLSPFPGLADNYLQIHMGIRPPPISLLQRLCLLKTKTTLKHAQSVMPLLSPQVRRAQGGGFTPRCEGLLWTGD